MKAVTKVGLILLFVSGLFLACTGEFYLENSSDFKTVRKSIKKIVIIEPDVVIVKTSKRKGDRISITGEEEIKFSQILGNNAELNGIEAEIIDAHSLDESDLDYFNHLLPLKEQIFVANVNQDVEHDKKKTRKGVFSNFGRPPGSVFQENPRFLSEYSWMSEKYGTPYFAVYSVFSTIHTDPRIISYLPPLYLTFLLSPRCTTIFFAVLVDVEKGEVIYREVRVTKKLPTSEALNSMTYDNFRIISRK